MVTMHFEDIQRVMLQNKQILEMFPFLWPVDDDGNRIPLEAFQFHTTLADKIPHGWGLVFAKDLFERTRKIVLSENIGLENYQYIRIGIGGNRISIVGNIKNEKLQELFDEIEYLSERTCADCGAPATRTSILTELPVCETCAMIISQKRGGPSREFKKYTPSEWIRFDGSRVFVYDGKEWKERKDESGEEKEE